jgi:hypothetical protein
MAEDEPAFCPESVNRSLPPKRGFETMPNFLIIVSFVFNALTVWYAWQWVA